MAIDLRSHPSDVRLEDYSIAPQERHIADAIAAKDPLYDVPGPGVDYSGSLQAPPRWHLSMLPPHLADPVREQLDALPEHRRADAEHHLVHQALEENSLRVRVAVGLGPDADPFWHEKFDVAREEMTLSDEAEKLANALCEVFGSTPFMTAPATKPASEQS
jgi:hypothetical protein